MIDRAEGASFESERERIAKEASAEMTDTVTSCADAAARLPLRGEDELSTAESHALEAHLDACAPCRAQAAAFEADRSVLADLGRGMADAPALEGFGDGVMARWRRERDAAGPAAAPIDDGGRDLLAADAWESGPAQGVSAGVTSSASIPAAPVVAQPGRGFAGLGALIMIAAAAVIVAMIVLEPGETSAPSGDGGAVADGDEHPSIREEGETEVIVGPDGRTRRIKFDSRPTRTFAGNRADRVGDGTEGDASPSPEDEELPESVRRQFGLDEAGPAPAYMEGL